MSFHADFAMHAVVSRSTASFVFLDLRIRPKADSTNAVGSGLAAVKTTNAGERPASARSIAAASAAVSPSGVKVSTSASRTLSPPKLAVLMEKLAQAGLLYRQADVPESVTGTQLHERFSAVLPSWLAEAFSHPFWERMTSGRGSKRLFTGWLIELYHYTKNANRHMPLSCAHAREKPIKLLRAKHYAEEWNHFSYFSKALKALDYTDDDVATSQPLPMTLALSNFMRQAARDDILAYSICSAVLEGTTVDRGTYNPYYEKCVELYGVPRAAVAPIYAHLDLDVQYGHSDLFLEILQKVDKMSGERASLVLNHGHQLV